MGRSGATLERSQKLTAEAIVGGYPASKWMSLTPLSTTKREELVEGRDVHDSSYRDIVLVVQAQRFSALRSREERGLWVLAGVIDENASSASSRASPARPRST